MPQVFHFRRAGFYWVRILNVERAGNDNQTLHLRIPSRVSKWYARPWWVVSLRKRKPAKHELLFLRIVSETSQGK